MQNSVQLIALADSLPSPSLTSLLLVIHLTLSGLANKLEAALNLFILLANDDSTSVTAVYVPTHGLSSLAVDSRPLRLSR